MTDAIPTLTTADDAIDLMRTLATTNDWVSVFWDRGWGDSDVPTDISIIVDGNGQQPKARITEDVYRTLLSDGVIKPNSLKTFKARRVHDYATPAPEPKPTINPADVAESVFRGVLADMADVPIHAEFYRGLDPDSATPRVMHEVVTTPVCGSGWFVRVLPGASDAAISAAGAYRFGYADLLGGVTVLLYPKTAAGDVDVAAMIRSGFRAEVEATVRAKYAEVVAEREQVPA